MIKITSAYHVMRLSYMAVRKITLAKVNNHDTRVYHFSGFGEMQLYRTLQCWSYQTYRYYYGQDDYGQDDRMRISKKF